MTNLEKRLREDLNTAISEYRRYLTEHNELQKRIEQVRFRIDYIQNLLQDEDDEDEDDDVSPVTSGVSRGKYAGMTAAAVIEAVLRERDGVPTRVNQMVEIAIQGGYGGGDLKRVYKNFSSLLSRASKDKDHPMFRKASRGMFTLAPGRMKS